jgi:hypothetical protein
MDEERRDILQEVETFVMGETPCPRRVEKERNVRKTRRFSLIGWERFPGESGNLRKGLRKRKRTCITCF